MHLSIASAHVTVIGGANTDVVGYADEPLVPADSNPGRVRLSSGGVARNIAENLARLGARTTLVTAFGSDSHGRELERECRAARIDTAHSIVCADLPGSIYLAILDEEGDMALALSDMRAFERLTPRALQGRRAALKHASAIVADTNIPAETLGWLAAEAQAPLVLDLVSTAKAPRARPILGSLAALKCNAIEAAALLEAERPEGRPAVETLCARLRDEGVAAVYVTAGRLGAYFSAEGERGWVDAPDVEIVNATGAGDAFTAGVVAGMLGGLGVADCASLGSRLAAVTLASASTVSEKTNPAVLRMPDEERETP